MTVIAENVVQTRDTVIWTEPYSSGNALPTDSAWGTGWGGSWRDMGGSDGGININLNLTYDDVTVDQLIDPVLIIPSGRQIQLTTNLAELTTANLKDTIGGNATLTTVAATAGVRGHIDADLNPTLTNSYVTVAADIRHPGDGEAIRIALWRAQGRGSPAVAFAPGAKAMFPFEAQGFPDSANSNRIIRWRDVSAALP